MKTDKVIKKISKAAVVFVLSLHFYSSQAAQLEYEVVDGGFTVKTVSIEPVEFEVNGGYYIFGPSRVQTAIWLLDDTERLLATIVCNDTTSHTTSSDDIKDLPPYHPQRLQYFEEISEGIKRCNQLPFTKESKIMPTHFLVNHMDDIKGSSGWQLFMTPINSVPETPSFCNAEIPEPLRFGDVSSSGPHLAETSLLVKCSQNIAFAVKVNNSREFIDPESGTHITFEEFSTGSLALDCKDGCTIPIDGEMTSAPTKPGKYQWAVPVIIEYK